MKENDIKELKGEWTYIGTLHESTLKHVEDDWEKRGISKLFRRCDPQPRGSVRVESLIAQNEIGIEKLIIPGHVPES